MEGTCETEAAHRGRSDAHKCRTFFRCRTLSVTFSVTVANDPPLPPAPPPNSNPTRLTPFRVGSGTGWLAWLHLPLICGPSEDEGDC